MSNFVEQFAAAMTGLSTTNAVIYPGFGPEVRAPACVTVIPTGGLTPSLDLLEIRGSTFQINCYDITMQGADTCAQSLRTSMHGEADWALSDYTIRMIYALQEPYPMGIENGRYRVLFNVLVDYYAT